MVSAAEGEFEAAFQLFSDAVGAAAAHQNVGLLLLRDGRDSEALAHLEFAADQDPSLRTARIALATQSPGEPSAIRTVGNSTAQE